MQFTNRYNLPQHLVDILVKPYYEKSGDYSVTELLKPPRMVELQRRHFNEITIDVIDLYNSFFGTMAHKVAEENTEGVVEKRYSTEILEKTVTGKIDWHSTDGTIIRDYKFPSVWSLVYGTLLQEAERQLNLYAYLLRCNGYSPKILEVVVSPRDWDRNRAKREQGYPDKPFNVYSVPLWSLEKQQQLLTDLVGMFRFCKNLPDDLLEDCTSDEMWTKPTKYAVTSEGQKKAIRVLDTYEEAISYCKQQGFVIWTEDKQVWKRKVSIVTRQGERTRCKDWCMVNRWCDQYKKYISLRSL